MTITWHNHNWTLDGERALYWPLRDTPILGDLHFGRSAHFQRAGIALTERRIKEIYFDLNDYSKSIDPPRFTF